MNNISLQHPKATEHERKTKIHTTTRRPMQGRHAAFCLENHARGAGSVRFWKQGCLPNAIRNYYILTIAISLTKIETKISGPIIERRRHPDGTNCRATNPRTCSQCLGHSAVISAAVSKDPIDCCPHSSGGLCAFSLV